MRFMLTIRKILFFLLMILAFHSYGFGQNHLYINEFLASNSNTNVDPDFSAFVDWIEIYNEGDVEVDLSGYFLSDDFTVPEKWQIPNGTSISSNAFLIIWADGKNQSNQGIHTNFKLNADGEEFGLFDKDGIILDSISFVEQASDVSYGRKPDGAFEWMYYSQPTPGSPNETVAYPSLTFSADPEFSHLGGLYASNLQLILSSQGQNSTIRYTLDGSIPDDNSPEYQNPIQINGNSVIRARTYETGKLPGKAVTRTFILHNDSGLPVFSVTTNPEFLWSEELGIYVYNDLERRKEWERPVHLEFFDQPNNSGFNIESDIRLFGNTAYLLPQKSLSVFPKSTLDYALFSDKNISTYESFILRSSSDDWHSTMFRDAMIQNLIPGHFILDYQAYRPSIVYLNGQYFGIHNIREKFNKDYLASNHGVDPDNIDLLALSGYTGAYYVLEGDAQHYDAMMEFIGSNDMTLDENYEYVKTLMDVDDFIDWCIMQNYIKNHSWKHNIKVWRPKTEDGKWKWLLFDTDRGYVTPDDTLIDVFYEYETRFHQLMNNENFKSEFLQRYNCHINISFRAERVIGLIDEIKSSIESEMPNHIERWADSGGVQSMEYWEDRINVMKDFAYLRKGFVREYVDSFFGLDGTAELTININESDYGFVEANGIAIPFADSAWVYFKDIPIRLEAIPKPGYEFIGWDGISTENEIFVTLDGEQEVTALFTTDCENPTIVTEDQYLVAACSPYIITEHIVVEEGATLYAEPGVEILFDSDTLAIYVYGGIAFTGSEENPIFISSHAGSGRWTGIIGIDATLQLNYVEMDGAGRNVKSNNCEINFTNCKFNEPSVAIGDMISVYNGIVYIDHCELYGATEPGMGTRDGIDCDEVSFAEITNNSIFNIVDDGIDIGSSSMNVTLANNYIENCESMGISIGESTTAAINGNIVTQCEGGIQVHTNAIGYLENNTLYNNLVSLKLIHYNHQTTSGGTAHVSNTIFSNSTDMDYQLAENSALTIGYSISNSETLPGENNLFDDPGFRNPEAGNFNLMWGSPCINSGDPGSVYDPDGTRADIGALYYDHLNNIHVPQNESLLIYPNPTSGILTVMLEEDDSIQRIEVTNYAGQRILVFTGINSDKTTINCSNLSNGIYVFHVENSKGDLYSKKVLVF